MSDSVDGDRVRRRHLAEIAEILRTGPFEEALKLSISSSGLTLARLEYHLSQRGFSIGRSTLSYWQQGRRRPERADSMAAIGALEEILGLPHESLSQLLGPRKPRGRWIGHLPGSLDWADVYDFAENIEKIATLDSRRQNNKLEDVFLTDQFQVGKDRRKQWLDTRTVVRAREDGADRQLLIYYSNPDVDVSAIDVDHLENCRIGRQRNIVSANFMATEFLFDRLLTVGDTHLFGYRVVLADAFVDDTAPDEPAPSQEQEEENRKTLRAFRHPVPAFTLQGCFHPDALPIRCYHVQIGRSKADEEIVAELPLTAQHTCHVALQDVHPGVHGIRWEWE